MMYFFKTLKIAFRVPAPSHSYMLRDRQSLINHLICILYTKMYALALTAVSMVSTTVAR